MIFFQFRNYKGDATANNYKICNCFFQDDLIYDGGKCKMYQ